ncbi:MAG: hypothetical protein NTW30_04395 [Candidatus Aenigmarchaeota archaeon]|nr:hypothetical protein [Candidatus Aenigmarchaeota archaeon]
MNIEEKLTWYKKEFEIINSKIKTKKSLSHYDFLRIRNYKLQSLSNAEEQKVMDVTEAAFNLAEQDQIEKSVNKLTELNGVRIPIASAILAMRFPERYAIIDGRVIGQLEKEGFITELEKEELQDYSTNPKIYKKYLELMKKLANEKNIKLREFERGLFERSYEKNDC